VIFGHMMLSLCTNYWQVLLAQALCIGSGTGALFVPGVAILSTYFNSRLALTTGIAASGSSLGMYFFSFFCYWNFLLIELCRRCHIPNRPAQINPHGWFRMGSPCNRIHHPSNPSHPKPVYESPSSPSSKTSLD